MEWNGKILDKRNVLRIVLVIYLSKPKRLFLNRILNNLNIPLNFKTQEETWMFLIGGKQLNLHNFYCT